MTKSALRREFLAKRKALTNAEINQRSQRIAGQFFTYFDNQVFTHETPFVHTFLPIQRHNEVNTWLIIQKIWAEFTHIGISVPVINPATRQMTHYTIYADTPLVENKLGIPEPAPEYLHKTDVNCIVTVLVPLVTLDRQGNRVGYGGGYYDRFLAECRPDCLRIGLSLFEPVEQINGIESTDIQLNACVTPEHTYLF